MGVAGLVILLPTAWFLVRESPNKPTPAAIESEAPGEGEPESEANAGDENETDPVKESDS